MSAELPALRHLMGAYYYQDWDLDYANDETTVGAFICEAPDLARELPHEIERVLATDPTDQDTHALLTDLGCQVDPSGSSNGSYRTWLTELAAYARDALARRTRGD